MEKSYAAYVKADQFFPDLERHQQDAFSCALYEMSGVRALAHGRVGRDALVPVQIPRLAMTNRQLDQVADAVITAINSEEYAFILVNFANGDMVGHTAVREAVIKAVESLDREVGRVLDSAVAHEYSVILTADHGNCDEMINPNTGEPHTQHTEYPVPFLLMGEGPVRLSTGRGLADVAPTILELLGVPQPPVMTGRSLIRKRGLR